MTPHTTIGEIGSNDLLTQAMNEILHTAAPYVEESTGLARPVAQQAQRETADIDLTCENAQRAATYAAGSRMGTVCALVGHKSTAHHHGFSACPQSRSCRSPSDTDK